MNISSFLCKQNYTLIGSFGQSSLWIRNALYKENECNTKSFPYSYLIKHQNPEAICEKLPVTYYQNPNPSIEKFNPGIMAGEENSFGFHILVNEKNPIKIKITIDPKEYEQTQELVLDITIPEGFSMIERRQFSSKTNFTFIKTIDPGNYAIKLYLSDNSKQALIRYIQLGTVE